MTTRCKLWPFPFLLLALASPAFALLDTTKPAAPKNFRVPAVTPFNVSLAWSPATRATSAWSTHSTRDSDLHRGELKKTFP